MGSVQQINLTVRPITEYEHDQMVRCIIRWAKRTGRSVPEIGEVCATLGLDLGATLKRAAASDSGEQHLPAGG